MNKAERAQTVRLWKFSMSSQCFLMLTQDKEKCNLYTERGRIFHINEEKKWRKTEFMFELSTLQCDYITLFVA